MNKRVSCPSCARCLGMMSEGQFIYNRGDVLRPSLPCPVRCRCGAELLVGTEGDAVYSGASLVAGMAEQPSGVASK